MTLPQLITLAEAAELIPGVDVKTLARRVRQGKLAAYRPGKFYMTTHADVQEFIQACRVQPKECISTSSPPVGKTVGLQSKRYGASETERSSEVQELAISKMEALRKHLLNSKGSTSTPKQRRVRAIETLAKS